MVGTLRPFGMLRVLVVGDSKKLRWDGNWCKIIIIRLFDVNTAKIRVVERVGERIYAAEDG
jgi:hypothetical protein